MSRTIPTLGGALPVLGHFLEYNRDLLGFLRRAYAEGGPVVRYRLAFEELVMISGPAANEAFFRAPEDQLSNREAYRKSQTPIFGPGIIFDVPLDVHMEQLQMQMGALRDGSMRNYAPQIAEETDRAMADWGTSGTVDFLDFMGSLAMYASARTLLGKQFRDHTTDEFAALYHDLEAAVNPLSYFFPNLPLPVFRRRDRARARLGELVSTVIAERRRTGETGDDMLQHLMEVHYKDGRPLSDYEITGLLLFLLFAGHHSTSVSTVWTMIELHRNPEWLAKVRDEIDRVYPSATDPVTFQSLRDSEVLHRAVKETLRKNPPLVMMMRKVLYDFEFDGYVVPAGTLVVNSPAVGHYLPEVYREPERFDPDRFSDARHEDENPYAYTAFGGGKHRCLGMNFAFLQIKTMVTSLLRAFDFELAGDRYEPALGRLIIAPESPCRFHYRRRETPQRVAA